MLDEWFANTFSQVFAFTLVIEQYERKAYTVMNSLVYGEPMVQISFQCRGPNLSVYLA